MSIRKLQAQIIKELGVKNKVDCKEEIRNRVDFLKNYLKTSHTNGFVLGISGGQDSTLAGKLAQMAVDELQDEGVVATFVAVRLPYGTQKDEDDAQLALQFIQPTEVVDFNIQNATDSFTETFKESTDSILSDYNKGNVKARMRMIAQYAIGGAKNLLVIGTDHAAEAITGFYTKFGDNGVDILPISGLTKRQGKMLLEELNAPERLYLKVPTADLLDDKPLQTDEDELGMTYDEIDSYLEGLEISDEAAEKIESRFLATRHKRTQPVTPSDNWWK
ncbi:NAD synthetase [Bacillus phage G]|uniref:Gp283 n=1 Tax=Bacillus phage G TaxID=2884420 RepID=G3MA24_9CAUD|nr:NAD synthetase [Bacillus phage G]AEO93542.1 gp283 [Bacillus phage G]